VLLSQKLIPGKIEGNYQQSTNTFKIFVGEKIIYYPLCSIRYYFRVSIFTKKTLL